jgi:WD40 repeat protein/serine/threonine protein kinase
MTHLPEHREDSTSDRLIEGRIDPWIEQLIAFDRELAHEPPEGAVSEVHGDISPQAVELLDSARDCLRLLHAARRTIAWPTGSAGVETLVGGETPVAFGDVTLDSLLPRVDRLPETNGRLKKLDRFEIIDELGQGGYGIIYRAVDPQLNRVVALKVPRPEIVVATELRWRVWREARAAAGLSHPNIATVYEIGQLGPVCWIAQEYCRGPSLDDWLARFRHVESAREAAQFVATLADGVEHAHGRGVLHRDLKPSNVLLEPVAAPASGRWDAAERACSLNAFVAKLTDFGLAKIAEPSGEASSRGIAIGTPRYMAPEQIEGHEDQIGRATDVYGLGAVLYEVWTGAPVFVGGTQAESFHQVLRTEPIPPSRMRRDTPGDFEAIIRRCLEKSAGQRYPTAAALADDLRRFQAGLPTAARPLRVWQRAARWSRREPAWATVAALAVVAPLILLLIAIYHSHRLDLALGEADAKRELAESRQRELFRQSYPDKMRRVFEASRVAATTDARRTLERFRPVAGEENLCGFEWGHLAHLCQPPCQELVGHDAALYSAAVSPDGKWIVTGSKDGTARVWDAGNARAVCVLRGHESEVNGVAFSPDGTRVASASDDRTVRIWDRASGREILRLTDCKRAAINVAYTPDGRLLLASCADPAVKVWNARDGQLVDSMIGHQGHIDSLAVSSDGKFAVTGADDRTIREWDLETFKERRCIRSEAAGFAQGVAIAPQRDRVAACGADAIVRVWGLAGSARKKEFPRHRQQAETIAFSPDGSLLASGGHDGQIVLLNSRSGAVYGTIQAHTDRIWCVTFTPDGRHLVSAGADKVARIWDLQRSVSRHIEPLNADFRKPFAVSATARRLAAHAVDTLLIAWWDLVSGTKLDEFDGPSGGKCTALAVSPDDQVLAIGGDDCTVRLLSMPSRREALKLIGLAKPALAVEFSASGDAVVARTDGMAVVWDAKTGQQRFSTTVRHLRRVAVSPDGKRLATVAAAPANIHLWNVTAGKSVGELRGHRYDVHDLKFSPDGDTLASVGADASLRLWSFDRRAARIVLPHDARGSVILAFSADGRTLAAARSTHVDWIHVATGQRMWTLRGTYGRGVAIQSISFAADNSALFALNMDRRGRGQFCRWDASSLSDID